MENFFKLNRYNLRHRKKKKKRKKTKSNLKRKATFNQTRPTSVSLTRYVFTETRTAIMSSRPTKITEDARSIRLPSRHFSSTFTSTKTENKIKGKNRKDALSSGQSLSLSLSHFRTARGPWQLLTFIRTPCRSFHVVSFGHRAARCIPMQITLAPGTRRNRRNFMLLRNATCPPSPSFPLSFLAQTMSEEGSLNDRFFRYVSPCRWMRWLFTTMIYFICPELNNETTTGNVGHLFITVYGGPKSTLRIDEWPRRGPV